MIAKKKLIEEFYKIVEENKNISFIFKKFIKVLIENGADDIEGNFDIELKYLYITFRFKKGKKKRYICIDYTKSLGIHITYTY